MNCPIPAAAPNFEGICRSITPAFHVHTRGSEEQATSHPDWSKSDRGALVSLGKGGLVGFLQPQAFRQV